jgi:hypothetical protein
MTTAITADLHTDFSGPPITTRERFITIIKGELFSQNRSR